MTTKDEEPAKSKESDTEKTPFILIKNEKPDLRKKEQPLVDLKVTNPITYLKKWWKRVIANEGIDFRFRIRPLTAIAISVVVAALYFGVGRIKTPFDIPFFEFIPADTSDATPIPKRETAFIGLLKYTTYNGKYYLITSSSEAIQLEVPEDIDLKSMKGKRIFASGGYNPNKMLLVVNEITDMEILPATAVPVPTKPPTPKPTPTTRPTPKSTPVTTPTSEPSVIPTEQPVELVD